jgi:hypothetical protein
MNVDSGFGLGVYPVVFNPVAGKVERMNTILVGNGQVNPPVVRHRAD